METISNMANAAAKAVWGTNEYNEEPVSGKTGDVSKGEPYDAGNASEQNEATTVKGAGNLGRSNGAGSGEDASRLQSSSTGKGDQSRAQQDVRSPTNPQTTLSQSNERSNVDDSGAGNADGARAGGSMLDTDSNPEKVDGPGPRPIDEVARERGGDAGNVQSSDEEHKQQGSDASAGDGPQKESHGSGTGEQYVKSTGLKADGGDFDATKPGAGREADRLLEEKGIHKGSNNKGSAGGDGDGQDRDSSGNGKKKLGEKIKAKLHKSHGSG
ncbi:hypothetical protein VTK73DRAFT_5173 [Phialemonium thermophilum]|uniref:Glycine-rich cell wall structural protein 1 n=1 Tax=Phialemonium thermophilum TaxID=223376 RepID=A0ABR3XXQ3_9PEZI